MCLYETWASQRCCDLVEARRTFLNEKQTEKPANIDRLNLLHDYLR